MRDVLLIAFHFPPVQGSSGVQRTLRFAQHLPKFGWRPIVLTIDPRAHEQVGESKGNEMPAGLEVHRAFGLDAARQLAIGGRYWRRLALPDRWATWRFWAVRRAIRIVNQSKVRAIWSTFPIATAHAVGLEVAARTGLPWIAEFRDPMWQGSSYPSDRSVNATWKDLETSVFEAASAAVVTTPGAGAMYAKRFGTQVAQRIRVIANGYDEETFQRAEAGLLTVSADQAAGCRWPARLLHSGVIYPVERNPKHLFRAISSLKSAGMLGAARLRVTLRASGHDDRYRAQVQELDIADIVEFGGPLPYLEALREMMSVEGLLLLQAANCNEQIPAKLYEYVRAKRPIVALTDSAGDTAQTLQAAGGALIAPLDDEESIKRALVQFMDCHERGDPAMPKQDFIRSCSRESRAAELASLLDEVVVNSSRADQS